MSVIIEANYSKKIGLPGEVVATIYKSLGLDLDTHLPGPQGRPFALVDFGVREVKELF